MSHELDPGYGQPPKQRAQTHSHGHAVAPSTLPSLTLDPLTVAGDATFLDRVAEERVLPAEIASGLRDLY